MIDLGLSVLFSSLIFVIFKLYDRFRIDTVSAIVVNYFTACTVGLVLYNRPIELSILPDQPWFFGSLALGVLFIIVFNLMARTSQRLGVSVASVATKMSLAIPVVLGVILYGEYLNYWNILGVILALAAVFFASLKGRTFAVQKGNLLLPMMVFIGSGIIDASIKLLENTKVDQSMFPLFSSTIFAAAGTTGILYLTYRGLRGTISLSLKDLLGGVALGVPNFFSIYFLLRALRNDQLNSASVFTINNVAIVMFTTLLGIVLFRERLLAKNWFGILLAVVSILLVALM